MPSVRGALRAAVKSAAAAKDRIRPPGRGLVVLIYHRVAGGTDGQVDLPVDLFRAQMEELAATERVVTLDAALKAVAAPSPPADGRDPIVITFDDGTADFTDRAFPVLAALRLPVTLYVATSFVEAQQPFPWGAPPTSWPALADAVSTKLLTIGSHTHRHLLLDRVTGADADTELDRSIDLITSRLSVRPVHFAYPKAVGAPADVAARVRARFHSAAVAGTRPNLYGRTNPYALARSPIQRSDEMRYFRRKVAGGMGGEDALRRLVNRRRYAGAVT